MSSPFRAVNMQNHTQYPIKRWENDASEKLRHNRFLRRRHRHPIEDGFWRHLRQDLPPKGMFQVGSFFDTRSGL